MTWHNADIENPPSRGWYLIHIKDKHHAGYRADGDTKTNGMAVCFWNGSKFPYNNHYHKVDYWTELPEDPENEEQITFFD